MELYEITVWVDVVGKDRMATGCRCASLPIVPDLGFSIGGLYAEPLYVEHIHVDAVSGVVEAHCYKIEEDRKLSSILKQFACGWEWGGYEPVVVVEQPPAPPQDAPKPLTSDDLIDAYLKRRPGTDGSTKMKPGDVPPGTDGTQEK